MNARRIAFGIVALGLLALAAYWFGVNRDDQGTIAVESPRPATSAAVAGSSTLAVAKSAPVEGVDRNRAPSFELDGDGTAPVPLNYQFAGVEQVQTGIDFEDWMAQYSEVDQKIVRAFNEQHFGMYEDRTPESIAWMAANGYPMPEDIIAAQAISTERLQQMAKGGNDKAAFLLKDRYLSRLAEELDTPGLTRLEAFKRLEYMGIDRIRLPGAIYRSASPYKGYLSARASIIEGSDPGSAFESARVLAGLTWAKNLGDLGAEDLILDYVHADPDERNIRSLLRLAMIATTNTTLMQRQTRGADCGAPAIPYPRPESPW